MSSVLYVDDNEMDGMILEWQLRKRDIDVTHVFSLREAAAAYLDDYYILVVIDWNLEPSNGAEVAHALLEIDPDVKVIFYSGAFSPDRLKAAQELNPLSCLTKTDDSYDVIAEHVTQLEKEKPASEDAGS